MLTDISSIVSGQGSNVEQLTLRKYQDELLPHALLGSNVVICAPTGSGKTFVAVKIILDHLQSGRFKKIAFFTPTVPLMEQQAEVIKRFLPRKFRVARLAGGTTASPQSQELSKLETFRNSHVLIMTPEILLNLMTSLDERDRIRINDLSLLIFDECHHTTKGQAYNRIMMHYLDSLWLEQNEGGPSNFPQIVGMTASLCVNKAENTTQACNAILDFCAGMACHYLETIKTHTEELHRMVNVPRNENPALVAPATFSHPFSIHIQEIMREVESYVDSLIDGDSNLTVPKTFRENRWGPQYVSWLAGMRNKVAHVHDRDLSCDLTTYLDALENYHKALKLASLAPVGLVLNFLDGVMESFAATLYRQVELDITDLYYRKRPFLHQETQTLPDAAIVTKLKEVLLDEYQHRPESRTIVFVETQELTQALEKFVNENDVLGRFGATRLVGVSSRDKTCSQTTAERQRSLNDFKTGIRKILVATSVANEGLEVATCNLVIKYNHVTDLTAMIQRKGRGRAAYSRSILLTEEARLASQEILNMAQEVHMKEAIERIRNYDNDDFRNEMEKRQIRDRELREAELSKNKLSTPAVEFKKYLLKCKKCKSFVCHSEDLRITNGNAHVAVDPAIWCRITNVVPMAQPKLYGDTCHVAKLYCSDQQCGNPLGVVIKHLGAYLPCPKISNVVLFNQEANVSNNVSEWKKVDNVLFVVKAVQPEDVSRMILKPPKHLDRVIEKWIKENATATALEDAAIRPDRPADI